MNNEKKKGRRSYLSDYERNSSGEYIFKGNRMVLESDLTFSSYRLLVSLSMVPSTILLFIAGLFSAKGMKDCTYVIIPYALAVIAALFFFYKTIRLFFIEYPVKDYIYRKNISLFRPAFLILFVFIFAKLSCYIIFVILNNSDVAFFETDLPFFIFLILSDVISMILLLFSHLKLKKFHWMIQEDAI